MKRESVNPWGWGLKWSMDPGEVVEGARRTLHCSGQVAVKLDLDSELGFAVASPGVLRGQIADSLAPGGLLVIEGFHRDLGLKSIQGGTFGYHTNELLRAFDGLCIVYYEDVIDDADWARSRPGKKPLVRLVARKAVAAEEGGADDGR